MNGTEGRPRCRSHLGVSPAIVTAQYQLERQAVILFEQATEAARREGVVDLVDPLHALHVLADETWRWKEVCARLVGELQQIRYQSGKAGEQVRAEITLYERAMERAGKLLAEIVRLGIENRLMRVTAAQVDDIERVIDGTLRALGHDPSTPEVAAIVEAEFRALDVRDAERAR